MFLSSIWLIIKRVKFCPPIPLKIIDHQTVEMILSYTRYVSGCGNNGYDVSSLSSRIVSYNEVEGTAYYHPRLINCKDYELLDWKSEELLIFIISTSGDGKLPMTEYQQVVGL